MPILPSRSCLPPFWMRDTAAYLCLMVKMLRSPFAHPQRQMYLSLHRLCPGGGDARRNACTPHGGHSPLGPGPFWFHFVEAQSSILPHLPQSGHAVGGGIGTEGMDQFLIPRTPGAIPVYFIPFIFLGLGCYSFCNLFKMIFT